MPISHVAGRNRPFVPIEVTSFASTQGSSCQTSFHIEICMGIDVLKPNRYVRTKIRPI